MLKIVLGIAAVLMLATAFFGFETRGTVQELRETVKTSNDSAQKAQASLSKAKEEAKSLIDQAAAEKQRAEAAVADAATVKADAQKSMDQAKDLQAKLDTANAQVQDLTAKVSQPIAPTAPTVSTEELTRLQGELKEAQAKAAEVEQVRASLESKAKAADAEAGELRQKEQRRQAGVMRPGLEGQVLAVNPGWGFVVLSLGDRQGAVMNAEMLVVRGDSRIAKIRITSVEPSTSVADVVPGSTARGAVVEPGDRVIFKGQ